MRWNGRVLIKVVPRHQPEPRHRREGGGESDELRGDGHGPLRPPWKLCTGCGAEEGRWQGGGWRRVLKLYPLPDRSPLVLQHTGQYSQTDLQGEEGEHKMMPSRNLASLSILSIHTLSSTSATV